MDGFVMKDGDRLVLELDSEEGLAVNNDNAILSHQPASDIFSSGEDDQWKSGEMLSLKRVRMVLLGLKSRLTDMCTETDLKNWANFYNLTKGLTTLSNHFSVLVTVKSTLINDSSSSNTNKKVDPKMTKMVQSKPKSTTDVIQAAKKLFGVSKSHISLHGNQAATSRTPKANQKPIASGTKPYHAGVTPASPAVNGTNQTKTIRSIASNIVSKISTVSALKSSRAPSVPRTPVGMKAPKVDAPPSSTKKSTALASQQVSSNPSTERQRSISAPKPGISRAAPPMAPSVVPAINRRALIEASQRERATARNRTGVSQSMSSVTLTKSVPPQVSQSLEFSPKTPTKSSTSMATFQTPKSDRKTVSRTPSSSALKIKPSQVKLVPSAQKSSFVASIGSGSLNKGSVDKVAGSVAMPPPTTAAIVNKKTEMGPPSLKPKPTVLSTTSSNSKAPSSVGSKPEPQRTPTMKTVGGGKPKASGEKPTASTAHNKPYGVPAGTEASNAKLSSVATPLQSSERPKPVESAVCTNPFSHALKNETRSVIDSVKETLQRHGANLTSKDLSSSVEVKSHSNQLNDTATAKLEQPVDDISPKRVAENPFGNLLR